MSLIIRALEAAAEAGAATLLGIWIIRPISEWIRGRQDACDTEDMTDIPPDRSGSVHLSKDVRDALPQAPADPIREPERAGRTA